jgi:uncharacterized protein
VDRRSGLGAAAGLLLLLGLGCAGGGGDAAQGVPAAYARTADFAGVVRTSHYVTMRDGVRIAVDVLLPGDRGAARIPALLYQGRYWRSVALRGPARILSDAPERHGDLGRFKAYFVRRGYAWIDVDTRGSGASEGTRLWDYSPEEILDGGDLVDWIVAQPWSDGRIAGVGVSYSGAAAELLLANERAAVKAVAPLFCDFDQYRDILAPGGVPHRSWILTWADYTARLDRGILPSQLWLLRPFVAGVRPVPGADGVLEGALRAHRGNFDFATMADVVYRDDRPSASFARDAAAAPSVAAAEAWLAARFGARWSALGTDLASPHAYAKEVDASGAPVYAYSGWLDGGYARAAADRFATLRDPRNRLLLGPWDHALQAVSPRGTRGPSRFDHEGEVLRFLDAHLKGKATGLEREPRVHYFTIGAEKWRAADRWPPPATPVRWYAAESGALAPAPPSAATGEDAHAVDFAAGTGADSRWGALRGRPIGRPYPDRAEQDARLLTYTSAPLAAPLEVTGHPVVTIHVASTATDGAFFAYLEEVTPDGDVTYVTEGALRALHRKLAAAPDALGLPQHTFRRADASPLVPGEIAELTFDLHPISYRFAAGSRIRLALAGADADHFARIPAEGPVAWRVQRNAAHATSVVLPVAAAPGARAAR